MNVGKVGGTIKESGIRVVSVSGDSTSGSMGICVALLALPLTTWSIALHAEQPSSGRASAIPWLDLKNMSATRDRPLFAPDRRKLVPPSVAGPTMQAPVPLAQDRKNPQLTLMGIIQGPDGTLILLRDGATSDFLTVHSGDSIGTWRVIADGSYSAKLISGKDEIALEMFAAP
jgi:hypothetical protein